MAEAEAEEIKELMTAARERTRELFELAREEDLRESPGFGFRPVIWHLAHIGVFESYWLLQKLAGQSSPDERYERIFDPIKTPREESKNLPTRREMESYLARVREEVFRLLDRTTFDESDPLLRDAYVFQLVLEHEYQHQETLAYLLQLLAPAKKSRPLVNGARNAQQATQPLEPAMVTIPAGAFEMGSVWNTFAYDNELPAHSVYLASFKLDRLLTTNAEYARFVAEGGYSRREWWSDEGWERRELENWAMPLYWSKQGRDFSERTMFDEGVMGPGHPVSGISWYEAEAYARFRGKRLPTEAEWEKAASWDEGASRKRRFSWGDSEPTPALCNFDNHYWGTTPVGSFPEGESPYGCLDMTGNVWEWTADPFDAYPGFKPFPYPEYSEVWFDGDHRVLKGGSWATRSTVLRSSFRNFFRRHFRIAFAGLRCAEDA
ncbi:MAG TPA: ergothioneine biosynthesis protein EgtB [Pyrinomonadaceae bacterium]